MAELTKTLLWCFQCDRRFSILDVQEGHYFADTGICRECYGKMQKNPGTCFGKKTEGRRLGYDETTIECKEFCPDKDACQKFVMDTVPARVGKGKGLPVPENVENP